MEHNKDKSHPNVNYKELVFKLFCIFGVYVSFVISGVFEEKLYKSTFNDENDKKIRFNQPVVALLINGVISYILAEMLLYGLPYVGNVFRKLINVPNEEKKDNPDLRDDLIKVCITTTSIILFNLEDSNDKSSSKSSEFYTLLIGYSLLILSLFCDGVVGLKEKIIGHNVHHDEKYADYHGYLGWEYMRLFSFFFILFSVTCIGINCVFYDYLHIYVSYFRNKELLMNLVLYCVFAAIGQIFIYILLEKYGPLTLSMVTGIRKILSIAVSIVLFGKVISLWKFVSLMLGTLVIVWEIYDKVKRHDKKVHKEDDGDSKENTKNK